MTTGKLILEQRDWKRTALVWGASFLLTVAVLVPLAKALPWEGLARGAVLAIAAYVLMRCAYRLFSTLLPQRETVRTVTWTVTEDTLALQYLVPGAVLCWTYERSGSLWSAVAVHAAANALCLWTG